MMMLPMRNARAVNGIGQEMQGRIAFVCLTGAAPRPCTPAKFSLDWLKTVWNKA
jgi:hypothetical protein